MTEGLGLSQSAFPVFDTQTDPTSIAPRKRKWMLRFENRIKAMNLTDPERKFALVVDDADDDVHNDYMTLTVRPAAGGNHPPPGNDNYSRSVGALNKHYLPSSARIRDLQLQVNQARGTRKPWINLYIGYASWEQHVISPIRQLK